MSVVLWTAVVLIGGAGSVLRFLADGAVSSAAGRDFPLGTLVVNVSGAVILGLITGLALGHDAALLAEDRQHRTAAVNVIASLALGVAAAALGRLVGTHL